MKKSEDKNEYETLLEIKNLIEKTQNLRRNTTTELRDNAEYGFRFFTRNNVRILISVEAMDESDE